MTAQPFGDDSLPLATDQNKQNVAVIGGMNPSWGDWHRFIFCEPSASYNLRRLSGRTAIAYFAGALVLVAVYTTMYARSHRNVPGFKSLMKILAT